MKTTIYDIAKRAGVSAATVSNVLNERGRVGVQTRKKILSIAEELQYLPNMSASALKGKSTYTIGFFVPDVLNPVYMEYLKHAEKQAQELGFSVIMCSTENNADQERKLFEIMQQKNVDGFIITAKFRNEELLKEMQTKQIPTICIGHERPEFQFDSVAGDDVEAGKIAANYLLSLGHTNVAIIVEKNSASSLGRIEGFRSEFLNQGIKIDDSFIIDSQTELEEIEKTALSLLNSPNRPTAVFGGNDVIAVGIVQAARHLGLSIPKDISVIGLDDTFLCKIISPQLTTVSMSITEIGHFVINILVDKIERNSTKKQAIRFQPKLVARESVGKVE
ncbi:LacI family transcriptional regulator [Domibacillus indicus]|uniref:LacI family DNA-binding transcriptional regulator n=1 Tax=Domibacillus indicus TaxID=1437523 RepID=UPI00203F253A|nr:LacI family DNA-binding transcriptional regulator [Domibacillus indicus]MCM3791334.1 LacI family transcriptional regulator [Domibacillus indicus]